MLGFTQLVSLAAVSSTLLLVDRVKGDVVPTAPGPGDTFNEGSTCPIQWNLDTTGTWTNFTIQLMTGSNQAMTPLLTVASGLDGTTGTGKYEWECPQVDPNSATEPTETVMVNGKPVGWGTGRLSGASVSLASGSSAAGSTAAGSASASSTPSGMTTIISSSSSTTAPSTSSTSTSSSDSASSSSSSSSMSSASSSSSTSQVTASAASNSNNAASSSNQTGGAASSNLVFSLGGAALLAIGSSIVIFA
ncbi:hypothetical protein JCM5350_000504 [Sporobolomyces pararoseus]